MARSRCTTRAAECQRLAIPEYPDRNQVMFRCMAISTKVEYKASNDQARRRLGPGRRRRRLRAPAVNQLGLPAPVGGLAKAACGWYPEITALVHFTDKIILRTESTPPSHKVLQLSLSVSVRRVESIARWG